MGQAQASLGYSLLFIDADDYGNNTATIEAELSKAAMMVLNSNNGNKMQSASPSCSWKQILLCNVEINQSIHDCIIRLLHSRDHWEGIFLEFCTGSHLDSIISTVLSMNLSTKLEVTSASSGRNHYHRRTSASNNSIAFDEDNNVIHRNSSHHHCSFVSVIGDVLRNDYMNNSCSMLKDLSIRHTMSQQDTVSLCEGLKINSQLEVLRLDRCHLQDSNIELVVKSLIGHPKLRQLYLGTNFCGPKAVTALAQLLDQQELEYLCLYGQVASTGENNMNIDVGDNNGDRNENDNRNEADRRHDQAAVANNVSVRAATVQEPTIEINSIFWQALQRNQSLQYLDLGRNNLNDNDLKSLAWALEYNTNCQLEELHLQGNQFTDIGIQALASTLSTNKIKFKNKTWTASSSLRPCPKLRKIYLNPNPFGTAGARALLNAMTIYYNVHLEEVIIPVDSIDRRRSHSNAGTGDRDDDFQVTNFNARRISNRNNANTEPVTMSDYQRQLTYYGCLNRAGRRFLLCDYDCNNNNTCSSSSSSSSSQEEYPQQRQTDGTSALWPVLFARTGKIDWAPYSTQYGYNNASIGAGGGWQLEQQADMIYYLLKGQPSLFSSCSSQ